MAHQRLGALGSIIWNEVLAKELLFIKHCYFLIGETMDSPKISVDTKLVYSGNYSALMQDQMFKKSGLSFSVV